MRCPTIRRIVLRDRGSARAENSFGCAASVAIASRTSRTQKLPSGPPAFTGERWTPRSRAILLAAGEARIRPPIDAPDGLAARTEVDGPIRPAPLSSRVESAGRAGAAGFSIPLL